MMRYLAARVAQAVVAVFAVVLVTFVLFKLTSGDPALNILGPRASPEQRAALARELGLGRSAPVQFLNYSRRLVTGDFGFSNKSGASVRELLLDRAGPTIALVLAGAVLSLLIALGLAILTSRRRDSRTDHGIRLLTLVGLFLPTFWIGYLLNPVIAIPTGWFPVSGLGTGLGGYLASLRSLLRATFPAAADVPIAHAWCGVLGVPRDWCASVTFDPVTGLGSAGGYVGSGLTTTYLAGRTLADLVLGRATHRASLPWVGRRVRNWEPEPLRWIGVQAIYPLYRMADRSEYRSRSKRSSVLARTAGLISGR